MQPKQYWKKAASIGREVFENRSIADVDEQAGPAYFQGLALSRWIFWTRLRMALADVATIRGKVAVDFGCGFGLALPQLREQFAFTLGVDLVPSLSRTFCELWDKDSGGHPHEIRIASSLAEADLAPESVDLILALDVLEHFESLPEILTQFHKLLSPSGVVVVSGPSENSLYRLGRNIVGFSGDYHHQNVYQVMDAMSQFFQVRVMHRFPTPVPLFLIFSAKKFIPER